MSQYGPQCIKTFVLELGTEAEWPVNTTEYEHTFGCFSLQEALRDVVQNAIHGMPARIVATSEWEAVHGPLPRFPGESKDAA